MAVHVQYVYCHSYYGVHGYSDRGGRGIERVAVHIQYMQVRVYCYYMYKYMYMYVYIRRIQSN